MAARRQRGGGSLAGAAVVVAGGSSGGGGVGSGSGAALAMKTPAVTATAVGQTTINNQLIVAVAMATEMMTTKTATLTKKTS